MKTFRVTVNGKSYEVIVEEVRNTTPSNPAPEIINQEFSPKANPFIEKTKVKPQQAEASRNNSMKKITAPMPGVVLNIKVSKGESVNEGQTLLVLEAMKMENEISSPYSGTVKDILVSKGDSINTEDLLIIIE